MPFVSHLLKSFNSTNKITFIIFLLHLFHTQLFNYHFFAGAAAGAAPPAAPPPFLFAFRITSSVLPLTLTTCQETPHMLPIGPPCEPPNPDTKTSSCSLIRSIAPARGTIGSMWAVSW